MSKPALPAPTPIALVICESIYEDKGGKRALIGLFNQIIAQRFPISHGGMFVFVSITSLRPKTICKLDIVNAETDALVAMMEGPLQDDNPVVVCDLVFEMRNLVFPEPGKYFVRFWGNDQILMQRPIDVLAVDAPRGG